MLQVHHLNSRLFRITTSHMTGEPSFYHFSLSHTHTIFNSRQRKKAPRVTTSICSKLQSVSASLNKTFVHDSYSCCTPAAGLGHATHASSSAWRLRTPSPTPKPVPKHQWSINLNFCTTISASGASRELFFNDESSITFTWKEAVSIVTCICWLQLRSHAKLLQTVCVCVCVCVIFIGKWMLLHQTQGGTGNAEQTVTFPCTRFYFHKRQFSCSHKRQVQAALTLPEQEEYLVALA